MAGDIRFIGAPRSVINAVVSEQAGWRALGLRMLDHAKARCPVDESDERPPGPHLRDTLEARFVTGADPRILIGSSKQGQLLTWITDGTDPHIIEPVTAKALRFTSGGTVVFAARVQHPGTKPDDFLLRAIREVAQEAAGVSLIA